MAKKGTTKWVKIADAKVRHVWKCEARKCKSVTVSPDYYQNNGEPQCECDRDMIYSHTEILGFQGWLGTYTPDTDAGKVRPARTLGEVRKALRELAGICEDEDRFPIHTERARKALKGEKLGE